MKSLFDYLSPKEKKMYQDFIFATISHKSSQIDVEFAKEQIAKLFNRARKRRDEESMRKINKRRKK